MSGLIEEGEAIARYQLSKEELKGWVSAYQRNGEVDLRVTRRNKQETSENLLCCLTRAL
ncbi:DUF1153 domain-containing protein [Leisingera thetidis]|uniref:DUF1153 domain-containing protein n=1 Tax=Leisingera thetidis TaxID=2930199 RepID=UPI0033130BDF